MNIVQAIRNKTLKIFGDIKVFKYPFFMLYDPGSYLVKGKDMREVIKLVKEGDILIRGYRSYLDGYFIPGYFSHAGLYLGKVEASDVLKSNSVLDKEAIVEGDQIVIHAMAEGVFMEDILNFCRCDYLIVLRRNSDVESEASKTHAFDETFRRAIEHLGKPYDFKFDFADLHNLSCTEFVYVCHGDVMEDYGVKVKKRQVLFLRKKMIIPDDFVTSKFQLVWKSARVEEERLQKIRTRNDRRRHQSIVAPA